VNLLTAFQEGGVTMYLVLALNLCTVLLSPLALVLALVARFAGKARTAAVVVAWMAVLGCVAPMCAGVGGYFWGMNRVEAAVAAVDPEYKNALLEQGRAEASNNLSFGIGSGCCGLLPTVLALMLIPPKRESWDEV